MIYVIQAESGKEANICTKLARDNISAYAPARSLIIHKSAGWTKIINLLFPGYVFIDCDYSTELHRQVKRTDGVIRFLGQPTPISASEEEFMRLMINDGQVIPESTAEVDSDGKVTFTDGWLKGKEQYITYYNIRQKKASVEIYFGGRKHKANLGVDYVKI